MKGSKMLFYLYFIVFSFSAFVNDSFADESYCASLVADYKLTKMELEQKTKILNLLRSNLDKQIYQIQSLKNDMWKIWKDIEQKKKELEDKSKQLEEKKKEIERLKSELSKSSARSAPKDGSSTGDIEKMVKYLSNMKPSKAANMMNNMNTKDAAKILLKMNEKQAAEILNRMDPKKAAEVMEQMEKMR